MALTAASPSSSIALTTLPNEILDAIFEDPRISQVDLANYCLVNKRLRPVAQICTLSPRLRLLRQPGHGGGRRAGVRP